MSVDDQSVEQWARSHHFSEPLRLAEVEGGALAREPVAGTGLPLWVHAVGAVGWIAVGIAFLLGAGASVLGLLTAWLAGREAPAGGSAFWMGTTQLLFCCSVPAYAFYLIDVVRARRRQVHDMVFAVVTVVASAATFMVLRSTSETVPGLVSVAVIATGVLGAAVLVASILSRPSRPTRDHRKPPLRGPSDEADHQRYVRTREFALDIVVARGLEYAVIGWRTFSDHDRRAWSPPAQRT